MPIINNVFNGKLNLDVADYRISNGDYLDALNITRDAEGESEDEIVSNILGNSKIYKNLPTFGVNKVIGQFADKIKNRIYFFTWNSQGYNRISYYDFNTDSVIVKLESKTDSNGIDILRFEPSSKILSINIIHRDEGDLLFFLDSNLNEPRVINIDDNYGVNWKEEYLSVAKAPPIMPIKCVYENDNEQTEVVTNILFASINPYDNSNLTGENFMTFELVGNSYFSISYDKKTLTYNGVTNDVKIKLNLNLYAVVQNFNVKINLNGIPISTESSYGTNYYKELTLSSLTSGSYLSVQVSNIYGNTFTAQGTFSGSVSTPLNNSKVTINNLRNSLFQFRYRYVYKNFEKSVWSTDSIVPLPYQLSQNLTSQSSEKYTDNARISLSFSTGGEQVQKIELAFRRFSNNFSTDWQLIDQLDKIEQTIPNNDIYTYKFYNDGVYNPIDIIDTEKLQDYVPQKANAGELVNGNTLVYAGITEGYDSFKSEISVFNALETNGFFYDYNGLLFFAAINGSDSGSIGTTMKIYIYGVGTNTNNEVSTLYNAKAKFVIKALDGSNVDKGCVYDSTTDNKNVSDILNGISALLNSNGWTQISIVNNVLTMSYPTNITLVSSGTLLSVGTLNNTTTSFANVFEGSYQVGIMYFDSKGRTNGVISNKLASYNTSSNSDTPVNYCQPLLSIANRPPKWANYFQIVRSNNTTYNKRLFWISNSAYSNNGNTGEKYVYIGIDNIEYYNQQIKATEGVVYYNFTEGDRIRFIGRYDANGTAITGHKFNFDYEVLGIEINPSIEGIIQNGRFVKINYPPSSDITAWFNFTNGQDFQFFDILLYNYTQQNVTKNKLFFEFGKCFGIGNSGTDTAYHLGDVQSQSPTDYATTPAKINIVNGDLFFRKRVVPITKLYNFNFGNYLHGTDEYNTATIAVPNSPIDLTSYKISSQNNNVAGLGDGVYPLFSDNDSIFYNKTANPLTVRFKCKIVAKSTSVSWLILWLKFTNSISVSSQPLISPLNLLENNKVFESDLDVNINVPAYTKIFLISQIGVDTQVNIGFSDLKLDVINNKTISIIETSFSDVYNIVTNSNGRESVIDENAKKTYFPTMIRFGQSYQADTNINGTNRFYYENFDTYDRNFGDVQRLHVRDRYMKVYQKLKVGNVPVLTQIVKDVAGNPLQANSDQLINKIQYYSGDYGIGDAAESLAWNNFADYFVDDYRGVVCRLSQDGITPLSILYSTNAFFAATLPNFNKELNTDLLPVGQTFKGKPCIYGVFDAYTNKYILALEEINRYVNIEGIQLEFHQDPYTISFDEPRNRFESFYSYHPEMMSCLNVTLFTFLNGDIWKHKSNIYCNFYGVQYPASITGIFNTSSLDKKTWISVMETGNTIWKCPEIYTQMNSYGSQKQESELIDADFQVLESEYHASFLRDKNSQGGLLNGDALKGGYLAIKFQKDNANTFVFLNSATVKYINSPLNNR